MDVKGEADAVHLGHPRYRGDRFERVEVDHIYLVRSQMGDVEPAGVGIDVLIVETRRRPGQRDIPHPLQHRRRKSGTARSTVATAEEEQQQRTRPRECALHWAAVPPTSRAHQA